MTGRPLVLVLKGNLKSDGVRYVFTHFGQWFANCASIEDETDARKLGDHTFVHQFSDQRPLTAQDLLSEPEKFQLGAIVGLLGNVVVNLDCYLNLLYLHTSTPLSDEQIHEVFERIGWVARPIIDLTAVFDEEEVIHMLTSKAELSYDGAKILLRRLSQR